MISDQAVVEQIAEGIFDYLKKKNKLYLMSAVSDALVNTDKRELRVYLPRALNSQEKMRVSKLLGELTGSKTAIEFIVDKEIIDGYKIVFGDVVWDGSLSSRLSGLKL